MDTEVIAYLRDTTETPKPKTQQPLDSQDPILESLSELSEEESEENNPQISHISDKIEILSQEQQSEDEDTTSRKDYIDRNTWDQEICQEVIILEYSRKEKICIRGHDHFHSHSCFTKV